MRAAAACYCSYGSVGTPLSSKRIALYGRQIIEGMIYLEKVGFSVAGLDAGNVMLRTLDKCAISDFENSALGLRPLGA
eukprot:COSAG01_NODE_7952_length_2978_cov_1.680792_3_plen_78_part_00